MYVLCAMMDGADETCREMMFAANHRSLSFVLNAAISLACRRRRRCLLPECIKPFLQLCASRRRRDGERRRANGIMAHPGK